MKTKTLILSLAALATLPGLALAQGTYLNDPNDTNNHALVVAPGGNIGIGITNPLAPLTLSLPSGSAYAGYYVRLETKAEPSAYSLQLRSQADAEASVYWAFELVNDTIKYPNILAFKAGNIGIGTATPARRLHVMGDSAPDVAEFESQGSTARIGLNATIGGGHRWQIESSGGAFAIGDSTANADRFLIDVNGNVGVGTHSPQALLDVNGKINCTVLELTSDRNQKQDFAKVDVRSVLDRLLGLSITSWAFTNDAKGRHLGPMAQDWKAAYPELGSDDKHIGAGDLGSVALAAIQGLNEKLTESLKEKDAEIAALQEELSTLKTQHADFATRFDKLEKGLAQTGPGYAFHPSAGPSPIHSDRLESSFALPAKAGTPSADAR